MSLGIKRRKGYVNENGKCYRDSQKKFGNRSPFNRT